MISTVYAAGLYGIDGFPVTVECSGVRSLPDFSVVGLPDAAVREAEERITAAIENSGIAFPDMALTVNLAPADRRKEGSAFDLAILTAVLQCGGIIPADVDFSDTCIVGEVSLSGAVRSVRGVLCMAMTAARCGQKKLFVPAANAAEAAACPELTVYDPEAIDALRESGFVMLVRDNVAFRNIVSAFDPKESVILYTLCDCCRKAPTSTIPSFLSLAGTWAPFPVCRGGSSPEALTALIGEITPGTVIPLCRGKADALKEALPGQVILAAESEKAYSI